MAQEQGTTERILEAAIAELEAGGEAGLRIDRIVAAAKVSVASIYQRFGSREGLVQAVQLERYVRSMSLRLDEFTAASAACQSQAEFRTLVASFMDWIMRPELYANRLTRANVLGSSYARPDLQATVAAASKQSVSRIQAVLADAQDRGLITRRYSAEVITWWYSGSLIGRVEFEVVQPEGLAEEYNALYKDLVLRLLFDE